MSDREQLLDELQPFAFAIAYRMLGSVSEAEDVVQRRCCGSTARSMRASRSPRRARSWRQ